MVNGSSLILFGVEVVKTNRICPIENAMHAHTRIAWVFSDPGAAKQVLAAYSIYRDAYQKSVSSFFCDRQYSFFQYFGVQISILKNSNNSIVSELFDNEKYDIIITGISYTSNFEKYFINEGKKRNIKTIAIIDSGNYPESRFKNKKIIPDITTLLDTQWIKIFQSIYEGSTFIDTYNYYHWYLKNIWKPNLTSRQFNETQKTNSFYYTIAYAPEPISILKEKERTNTSIDEITGLEIISNACKLLDKKINLIVQPHPNQPKNIYRSRNIGDWIISKTNVEETIYYSDIIISINSAVIGEAIALGKQTISLFKNLMPLHFKNNKAIDKCVYIDNMIQLKEYLNKILV